MSPSIRLGLRASCEEGGANVPREGGENAWQEEEATKVVSNKSFIFSFYLRFSHVNNLHVGFSLAYDQCDGVCLPRITGLPIMWNRLASKTW